MKEIKKILNGIAAKKGVKILYACETGSRAWGFPSPDSDYDIRFIYMHERDWYLSLSQRKDTIEHMEGELDITGWDLRKALQLLRKSNAPLIERFQSPITYFAHKGFKDEFRELIRQSYSPIAVFYHHYSIAQKFWQAMKDEEEIKLKGFFYMVRSLLSCNWIIQDRSVLPMDIGALMTFMEAGRREDLNRLIELKSQVGEKYFYKKEEGWTDWIMDLFKLLDQHKDNLCVSNGDTVLLNEYFIKMVNGNTNS